MTPLRCIYKRQKRRNYVQLIHSEFNLNFLTLDKHGKSAAENFWHPEISMVKWRDPLNDTWHGPDPILIWGRGYVCVFSSGWRCCSMAARETGGTSGLHVGTRSFPEWRCCWSCCSEGWITPLGLSAQSPSCSPCTCYQSFVWLVWYYSSL